MDKKNMVYTHSGISLSLIKVRNSDTGYNMNETWKHYPNWNKIDFLKR